ncbi:hypothetical protein GOODEAATRI_003387 [Goodea atripinnis]|uniref:Uncharacterized protein n=1 Tax=Goodea atripinnis TaxID=208336 RepID=A0ABV0PKF8_9TELE
MATHNLEIRVLAECDAIKKFHNSETYTVYFFLMIFCYISTTLLQYWRKTKQTSHSTNILTTYYRAVVRSALTYSTLAWYSSCKKADKRALQRIVRGAKLKSHWRVLTFCWDLFQTSCMFLVLQQYINPFAFYHYQNC